MMALMDLSDWLNEYTRPEIVWYLKRLSGNDTLANGSHQAGPYIPKELLFDVFPQLRIDNKNPEVWFDLYIDSHAGYRSARAVWYNNSLHGSGTRNEARLTNFGGRESALLDPESTGSLTLFAFVKKEKRPAECHVWVSEGELEEDLIEERIGRVEPGKYLILEPAVMRRGDLFPTPVRASCHLTPDEMPAAWQSSFPTGAEIVHKAVEMRPDSALDPDARLLRRRDCEYEIFLSVENAIELPAILAGFSTIEDFIARAQTILQRRKSRSGRSLELHAREILLEEGFREGSHFEWQPESDPGKKPDFLFPNADAYKNPDFPIDRLRLLATKTTCKDRWRQVVDEAERISLKHLLTLQEGVSENQFRQMSEAGIQLVVPRGLTDSYPRSVRPHLVTFESFIADLRLLTLTGEQGR